MNSQCVCEAALKAANAAAAAQKLSVEPNISKAVDLIFCLVCRVVVLQYSSDYNVALWDLEGNRVSSTHNRVPTVCLI